MPVITATQMLEIDDHRPVAHAGRGERRRQRVFDGTDALMLSGETAIGHDPALVVATMARIAERAEARGDATAQWAERLGRIQRERWDRVDDRITAAVTHAAWQAADDVARVGDPVLHPRGPNGARRWPGSGRRRGCSALSPESTDRERAHAVVGRRAVAASTRTTSTDEMVWYAVERRSTRR